MAPGTFTYNPANDAPRVHDGKTPNAPDDTGLHELLTVDEVAALLKVSKSWVYAHTRARGTPRSARLPHLKLGKYVRFEARAVRDFLDRRCQVM